MAGYGALPKPAHQRVRRHKDTRPTTTIIFEAGTQPELPADVEWPDVVRRWWAVWGTSTLAEHFMQPDWEFLLDTALLKKRLWERESTEAAKELRLREDAFGVTLAARVKLRLQLAEVDAAEERRGITPGSRSRYGALLALPTHPEPGEG